MSTPLFPAAQAVLSEAMDRMTNGECDSYARWIAAALICHLVTLHSVTTKGGNTILSGDKLLAMAAELEGSNG
jgi:hypothetical protein